MKEVVVEGPSRKGRPLGRWKDRVKEYMCERGASRGSSSLQKITKCVYHNVISVWIALLAFLSPFSLPMLTK